MSIDGIGRSGPPGPPAGVSPSEASAVEGSASVGASPEVQHVRGSEALGKLERGELNLSQYLDLSVQQAVQHLQGNLPADQLGFVRAELRRQLETDPVLVELVRRTTGQVPAASDD